MRSNTIFLLLWNTFVVSAPLYAQPVEKGYLKIKTSAQKEDFTVIDANTNGLILIQKQKEVTQKKRDWRVIMVDTALQVNNLGTFQLNTGYDLIGYDTTAQSIFFLFQKTGYLAYAFQLVKISFLDKHFESFTIQHNSDLALTHFSILNETVLLGGYVNQKPAVLLYHMIPQKLVAVPGFFIKKSRLLDLRVNKDNTTFNTLSIEENMFRKEYLITQIFNSEGQLLIRDSTLIKAPMTILSGRVSGLQRDELIVLGTYTKQLSHKALGIYALPIEALSRQPIKYYDFSQLHHFFDYLGTKRAKKMKSKAKQRQEAGKHFNYSAYLEPVEIKEEKKGFFLLAEMFSESPVENRSHDPTLQTNEYTNPSLSSRNSDAYRRYKNPYTYSISTKKEIKYIQAVVALFDPKGQLLLDAQVSMSPLKYANQLHASDFIMTDEAVSLACVKDGILFTNTVSSSTSRLDTIAVALGNQAEKTHYEYSEKAGICHWYGRYFCTWGYREVLNEYVFYVEKFEIQ